ncbi:MAG: DNA polymerase III subunit gamma/tau [Rhodospirillaceae bacterium]
MTESPLAASPEPASTSANAYRVLARKYRPASFAELVGQEALVRTLTNAIASGRIAQAFMLTGVRGVGKTTTARIIARALNCIGPDGKGGPTVSPCGVCEPCQAIMQDRHVDVLEMDAASHTGVDDIREIISGVRYSPVSARYKLYIIDEVHMLSKNAFNALLKTLEEPPSHVKFVFATTEIRKVPVTVLSRCQRFDLRRVATPVLIKHFSRVADAENVAVEADALALIARAADGSVRDGLSLLDQAIALGGDRVGAEQVRDMLGLADRAVIIDLFEATLSGNPAAALDLLADLHRAGADPPVILRDLLELTHFLTRAKLIPALLEDPATPEAERARGGALAGRLTVPLLTRAWQILLKGLNEAMAAPVPHQAVEMVIIRLSFAADLPVPGDLVRQARERGGPTAGTPPAGGGSGGGGSNMPRGTSTGFPTVASNRVATNVAVAVARAPVTTPAPTPTQTPAVAAAALPGDFRALVKLFADRREGRLYAHLRSNVHLIKLEPGLLELRPKPAAPKDLVNRLGPLLSEWTGRRWTVVANFEASGQPTIAEQDAATEAKEQAAAETHPLVRAVLEIFPGARITAIHDTTPVAVAEPPSPAEDMVEPSIEHYNDDEGDLDL